MMQNILTEASPKLFNVMAWKIWTWTSNRSLRMEFQEFYENQWTNNIRMHEQNKVKPLKAQ